MTCFYWLNNQFGLTVKSEHSNNTEKYTVKQIFAGNPDLNKHAQFDFQIGCTLSISGQGEQGRR